MISLCSNCINNEPGYQYDGKHYVQRDVCVYGMPMFPKAHACAQHETTVAEDNDAPFEDAA